MSTSSTVKYLSNYEVDHRVKTSGKNLKIYLIDLQCCHKYFSVQVIYL